MSNSKRRDSKVYRRRISSFYETPKSLVNKRPSFELVPIVRKKVFQLYEYDKEVCDESDINRIKSDDWSVQRFIEYYDKSIEEATHQLFSTLKWRKEFGVNSRSLETDCGKEFFNIGALVPYNEDKNGVPLIYLRTKCNRKVPELRPIIEMFFVSIIESVDKEVGHKGFALVMDCSDSGISNVSIDLLKFVITTLKIHYPLGLQYVLVYNIPWILRSIWNLVKGLLGEYQKYVRFANGEEIKDIVDIELLPKYLGGKCEKSFIEAPDNCPTVYDLAQKYGFTHNDVEKYMKVYEDLLIEAKNYDN